MPLGSNQVAMQYKGKEELFPLYENLVKHVNSFGKDVEISPKKAYVSLRRRESIALSGAVIFLL